MHTLEEINKTATSQGTKAFWIWFLVWMAIIFCIVIWAQMKNPDLTIFEIAFDFLPMMVFVFLSSGIFYALGYHGSKKKMREENEQEEQQKREEHYHKMEELLEKMTNEKNHPTNI